MWQCFSAPFFLLPFVVHAQPAGVEQGQQLQMEIPPDLGCSEGPRAAVWQSVKGHIRKVFGESGTPPFTQASPDDIAAALSASMEELNAVDALKPETGDNCDFGKLFVRLLSISLSDDPLSVSKAIRESDQFASPVLTLLLDIPWVGTAQSGWPFFGLLAQVNLRKRYVPDSLNHEQLDGFYEPAAEEFLAKLANAMPDLDLATMAMAAGSYMNSPITGSALGHMTAMCAQAAVSPLQPRLQGLQVIQSAFKQMVANKEELDVALSTRWPLWTLLHLAVSPLTVAGSDE